MDSVRAKLVSASITVVGASASLDRALSADADVVVAVDGAAERAVPGEDGGPALLVLGDDDTVPRVAASGHAAWGVVSPAASGPELRAAVAAVAEGLVVVPPDAARRLGPRRADDDAGDDGPVEALTPREREVLELASDGLSNRGVAAALGISEHTVKFHLASVYGKLGAGSRTEAVRRGLRRGLITM
jgi:DNA-binding NarL/FixJ family response regulator